MESSKYEKIDLPIDNDNVRPNRPDIKWLGWTLGAIGAIFLTAYISFSVFANIVITNIDLEREKEFFSDFSFSAEGYETLDLSKYSIKIPELESYSIHIIDDMGQENAFAGLGASIGITQELLDYVTTEEELFFIIAHEIGHVQERHLLKKLSRDIPMYMTLNFLGINFNFGFSNSSDFLSNVHSRSAETDSDDFAIELFKKHGLNTACATSFFEEALEYPVLLSSHPSNTARIETMKKAGNVDGECREIVREE